MIKTFRLPYTRILTKPSDALPERSFILRPMLSVWLSHGEKKIHTLALLDSGADDCLFPALLGREIGLEVEEGKKQFFSGVGSAGNVSYFHEVKLAFKLNEHPFEFECHAGFPTAMDLVKFGLLGRYGFFDLFKRLAFDAENSLVEITADL